MTQKNRNGNCLTENLVILLCFLSPDFSSKSFSARKKLGKTFNIANEFSLGINRPLDGSGPDPMACERDCSN